MTAARKLFFALFPPPVPASRIAELGQQLTRVHRLKGALVPQERLHCSLHLIDIASRDEAWAIDRAREAAARVRALAFDVALDRTASFGKDKRHFVLFGSNGVEPLRSFRAALGSAMYYAELRDAPASAFNTRSTTCSMSALRSRKYSSSISSKWRDRRSSCSVSAHSTL